MTIHVHVLSGIEKQPFSQCKSHLRFCATSVRCVCVCVCVCVRACARQVCLAWLLITTRKCCSYQPGNTAGLGMALPLMKPLYSLLRAYPCVLIRLVTQHTHTHTHTHTHVGRMKPWYTVWLPLGSRIRAAWRRSCYVCTVKPGLSDHPTVQEKAVV